jgi:hypothetical protein
MWHHSSVQVVGSQIGEFPDPRHAAHGEDFGGPTRRNQEPGGVCLQGSNRSKSFMRFKAVSTTIHHPAQGGGLRRHHVPTNPRRASVYFTFHRPTQVTGSGDATGSLYLALYVIMFIELNSNFMSLFTYLSLMWSITFSLSRHLFELCNPVANESP